MFGTTKNTIRSPWGKSKG